MTVFSLKNPGRGFCVDRVLSQKPGWGFGVDCVRSQKPGSGVCVDRVRSQKTLVGCVLTVLALKNPGRVDRVLSKKFIAVLWTLEEHLRARRSTVD